MIKVNFRLGGNLPFNFMRIFAPFGRGGHSTILPYIREGLTMSKIEKQSFTILKRGGED
jgi:hypothetical protein